MQLVQLFVQIEAAHDTVDELGKLGLIEFKDLNPDMNAFQRNFINDVKRCDEMERRLRFFEAEVVKEIRDQNATVEPAAIIDDLSLLQKDEKKLQIDELETQFDDLEKELQQMNSNQEMLNRNYNELIELKFVLQEDATFFSEVTDLDEDNVESKSLLSEKTVINAEGMETGTKAVKLGFVTGVVLRSSWNSFERVLWRSTRGNLFIRRAEIQNPIRDPHTGDLVQKDVFIIFYQGERSQAKIKKICETFDAKQYRCPDTAAERKELLQQVNSRLLDLEAVLERTRKHRRGVLYDIGKHLRDWQMKVMKEKAIYTTMNMFNYDTGRRCLIAEGWCPKTATEKIVNSMRQATESSGALVPSILSVIQSKEEPPTYFRTNKFTRSFQGLVDAYGIAHYREVNPAPFAIITFPFLFGVMFGDFGHGIMMLLFSLYLVLNEKKLEKMKLFDMLQTCFNGRYLLLLMSLFGMYVGLIYNECFSVPMDLFGSNWTFDPAKCSSAPAVACPINTDRAYEFGVDPAWKGAPNSLTFYNSLKMKLSILFGVTQMCLGIFMSLLNGIHFHHTLDIWCEFLPQIIFMLSIFGYMSFLILYKWCQNYGTPQSLTETPPFILNVIIAMFLSPVTLDPQNQFFSGQMIVQILLLVAAFVSVPWMLFVKPYILKRRHKMKMNKGPHVVAADDEEFDFADIMIKQSIHSIEFVLGCISNTASYLRLWALSLAHAELSEVFWQKLFF